MIEFAVGDRVEIEARRWRGTIVAMKETTTRLVLRVKLDKRPQKPRRSSCSSPTSVGSSGY